MAKQAVVVQLWYDDQWNTVTSDVLVRDSITINRGKADEQSQTPPATASMTFNSHDYNPRNPSSPLYGLIGRNTPIMIFFSGDIRFIGEVSSWTPQQSLGGPNVEPDRWVAVQAAGITRRLEQGADPLRSPIFREVMAMEYDSVRVAYWPCEDESTSTVFASAVPGIGPLQMLLPGAATAASYEGFGGSLPLPTIATNSVRGKVPGYTGDFYYRGLFVVPDAGFTDGAQMLALICSGADVYEVELEYGTGGTLRLRLFDQDQTLIDETSAFAFDVDGAQFAVTIELEQDGSDVDWLFGTRKVFLDGSVESAFTVTSGTFTSVELGSVREIRVGGTTTVGMSFGHQAIGTSQTFLFNIGEALGGWSGEHAGERIQRLCEEEDIPFVVFAGTADMTDTVPMGPQPVDTFLNLLRECTDTDRGLLIDGQTFIGDDLGITYRPHRELYNQEPELELDYDSGEVAPPLEPIVDDQEVRNDVTATRRGGSQFRATLDTGPLSTQLPPDGIGRYRTEVTVNPMSDLMLGDQAGWILHLGTVDETRYPKITVDLDANPSLASAIADVDPGDRITIDNLPPQISPDMASLIVLGWTEIIGSHRRIITFNCVPATPYQISEVEHDDYSVIGSSKTVRLATLNSTTTSITFNIQEGPDWVHEGDFDIILNGERMTVTAIAAAIGTYPTTRSQLFTVVRSVNGVVKSHPTETVMELFHKSYIGL